MICDMILFMKLSGKCSAEKRGRILEKENVATDRNKGGKSV